MCDTVLWHLCTKLYWSHSKNISFKVSDLRHFMSDYQVVFSVIFMLLSLLGGMLYYCQAHSSNIVQLTVLTAV